jgi:hypothetical protein
LLLAAAACGDEEPDLPAECEPPVSVGALATAARPPGTKAGEPYRWLARSWQSPLGLTLRTYGLAIDGIPVHGRHQVEVYDRRGQLVHRAGSGDAVLAALRATAAAEPRRWQHPQAALGDRRFATPHPLLREEVHPVWYFAGGQLVAAVASERLNLLGAESVAEAVVRDAATGAELSRRRTIFDAADPEYLVYAREDGRPLYSPLGDSYPHPTGSPEIGRAHV